MTKETSNERKKTSQTHQNVDKNTSNVGHESETNELRMIEVIAQIRKLHRHKAHSTTLATSSLEVSVHPTRPCFPNSSGPTSMKQKPRLGCTFPHFTSAVLPASTHINKRFPETTQYGTKR